jgi:LysR family transcriptional regulator, hydrogen peroxide-inducible genes activator
MSNITIRQLRYFHALVEQGQFGRAAQVCSISQPALSMQIKELEETLGGGLFERGARSARLTQFGASLLPHVREVLRGVEEISDVARATRTGRMEQLRLGIIPTVAPYLLPSIIANILEESPFLDLQVRETVTQKLIADLSEGHLDAAIVALPISEPTLAEHPLFSEAFVLVRALRDREKPVPKPEKLREHRLLLLEEGHCFREQALSFCKMADIAPREILEGSSLSTLVQMVGAGIGITLIPEMAIGVETRSATVSVARFAGEQPHRTIGMIWRKTSVFARELQAVAAVVHRTAEWAGLASSEGMRT